MANVPTVDQVAESAVAIGIAYAESNIKRGRITYGSVEEMATIARAADYLETLYVNLPEEVRDSAPGVWAYEVSAEVGKFLGSEDAFEWKEIEAHIKAIVNEFFRIKPEPSLFGFEMPSGNKGLVLAISEEEARSVLATEFEVNPDHIIFQDAKWLIDGQYNGVAFLTTEGG